MTTSDLVSFYTPYKDELVCKMLVFTYRTYSKLIRERGATYVFELFMEVCRENDCRFLGLRSENGYVFALLSMKQHGPTGYRYQGYAGIERGDSSCK